MFNMWPALTETPLGIFHQVFDIHVCTWIALLV